MSVKFIPLSPRETLADQIMQGMLSHTVDVLSARTGVTLSLYDVDNATMGAAHVYAVRFRDQAEHLFPELMRRHGIRGENIGRMLMQSMVDEPKGFYMLKSAAAHPLYEIAHKLGRVVPVYAKDAKPRSVSWQGAADGVAGFRGVPGTLFEEAIQPNLKR